MHAPASLFISHGAPDLVLHDTAARRFLAAAAEGLPRPRAIISVSAHFETDQPVVVCDPEPGMIYDFGNFAPELREIVYPAPGDPVLANRLLRLIEEAGLNPTMIGRRGYDHGTWVPLCLLYPAADIPVVQLSVQPGRSAHHHYALGKALRPLVEEGVLVIGSGAITHNLSELFSSSGMLYHRDSPERDWARAFADWVANRIAAGDGAALIDYREQGPFAVQNHPTEEHYLPLLVALGASSGGKGERLHRSTEFALLAMDAFAFE